MTIVHITYHDETNIGSCPIGQTGGFENADGNGEIHCFRIFDGVSVMLMQLEMGSYTEIRTQVGVLEVNFCINGRFETSFSMRSHVLLKPGDMAISCYDGLHGTKSESHFPLGYYEGLCLEIDPAAAGHWIRLNAPAFPIDFTALKQNLLGSKWYMVGPAGPRCEHVFRELYESASYAERGFLQLKVLELMLLLGRIPQERAADPYCSAEQTAPPVRHSISRTAASCFWQRMYAPTRLRVRIGSSALGSMSASLTLRALRICSSTRWA